MSICRSPRIARWGAEGSSSVLRCVGKLSPPRSDHPASTSLGTPMGIGVVRLQEYFNSLVIDMYLAVPNMSRANFLETAIVSGSGMFAGCCPGLVAAPFSLSPHVMVKVYRRQNWFTTTSVTRTLPSVNVWS